MSARTKLDVDEIGTRIARRRKEMGLEQNEVAERSGMSRAYVSRLETGGVKSPKLGDLASVAEALEMSLDALIYGEAPKTESDIIAILARMPGASAAMSNLARGLQWAEEEDRAFVVGTLEQLAQRFGRPTRPR